MTLFTEADGIDYHRSYLRSLQRSTTSRESAITIVYLIVLVSCFILPCCYFVRLKSGQRVERLQRQQELAAIEASVNEPTREETRAARKKFREEKRARILQLFGPVKVQLTSEHFCAAGAIEKEPMPVTIDEIVATEEKRDEEMGEMIVSNKDAIDPPGVKKVFSEDADTIPDDSSNEMGLEASEESDKPFIELPTPGFARRFTSDRLDADQEMRLVPNCCAICLANYEIGDSVVWSSNPACEHAFHEDCIERWLMKLRADPLCPCCRREFIVDPLDMEAEDIAEMILDHPSMFEFEDDDEQQQQQQQQQEVDEP